MKEFWINLGNKINIKEKIHQKIIEEGLKNAENTQNIQNLNKQKKNKKNLKDQNDEIYMKDQLEKYLKFS